MLLFNVKTINIFFIDNFFKTKLFHHSYFYTLLSISMYYCLNIIIIRNKNKIYFS